MIIVSKYKDTEVKFKCELLPIEEAVSIYGEESVEVSDYYRAELITTSHSFVGAFMVMSIDKTSDVKTDLVEMCNNVTFNIHLYNLSGKREPGGHLSLFPGGSYKKQTFNNLN